MVAICCDVFLKYAVIALNLMKMCRNVTNVYIVELSYTRGVALVFSPSHSHRSVLHLVFSEKKAVLRPMLAGNLCKDVNTTSRNGRLSDVCRPDIAHLNTHTSNRFKYKFKDGRLFRFCSCRQGVSLLSKEEQG